MSAPALNSPAAPPLATTRFGNLRFDAFAGFLVFLIAMPLCLAIAGASGFPPIAGIWTAVIGGVLTTLFSNAQLTIKGPAAGLIVIVLGAVTELGGQFGEGLDDGQKALLGYKLALGIGVAAGVLQVLLGLIRAGRLVDFFPLTPVHGLLASIGIIIIAKQIYTLIGVAAPANPPGHEPPNALELLAAFPGKVLQINPEIAAIGLVGLAILFGLPLLAKKIPFLKKIPGQLMVMVVAIGLGFAFDLEHEHKFLFPAHFFNGNLEDGEYTVGPKMLVTIPNVLANPVDAFAFPDFRGLATLTGLKFLMLFSIIGSLESLLSAKAIELIDPWRRKTNFDRDLLAVGVANTLAAFVGGLPMISEIVRSKANIDNGARTKWANAFHGLFLVAFVLLFPSVIHSIPTAALAAMLVYTGFRLASPNEFVRTLKVGTEQFIVFLGTIIATLATDLLIGIAVGIAIKMVFHLWHGAPMFGFFRSHTSTITDGDSVTILVRKAALFSNWLGLRRVILEAGHERDLVKIDLSQARLVDHSVMEKLHELQVEFRETNRKLELIGLEHFKPLSKHPLAARKNSAPAETASV